VAWLAEFLGSRSGTRFLEAEIVIHCGAQGRDTSAGSYLRFPMNLGGDLRDEMMRRAVRVKAARPDLSHGLHNCAGDLSRRRHETQVKWCHTRTIHRRQEEERAAKSPMTSDSWNRAWRRTRCQVTLTANDKRRSHANAELSSVIVEYARIMREDRGVRGCRE
jgi:hypothetical protein